MLSSPALAIGQDSETIPFSLTGFSDDKESISLSVHTEEGNHYSILNSHDFEIWRHIRDFTSEEEAQREVSLRVDNDFPTFFRLFSTPLAPPTESDPILAGNFSSSVFPTYDDWRSACAELPSNRTLGWGSFPSKEVIPLKSFEDFEETLDAALYLFKNGSMSSIEKWVGKLPIQEKFLNISSGYLTDPEIPFEPFVQKVEIPAGAEAAFHGDYHGDLRSLLAQIDRLNAEGYLDGFKIIKPDFYMFYLGDYTDRGSYGLEVVYTLLRLKLANPDHVHMARGNHEDNLIASAYGFTNEIQAKYGGDVNLDKYWRFFDFLPMAVYIGSGGDFIQACHGGMEPGYSPQLLLNAPGNIRYEFLEQLNRAQFLHDHPEILNNSAPYYEGGGDNEELEAEALIKGKAILEAQFADYTPSSPTHPHTIGFMWNDFYTVNDEPSIGFNPGRGFLFGSESTQIVLGHSSTDKNKVRAVFRGHQHSSSLTPTMSRLLAGNGIFRHWQEKDSKEDLYSSIDALKAIIDQAEEQSIPEGSVWTFNVSPDSIYGMNLNFNFDTFGILTTAESFSDWRLKVVNHIVE